MDAVDLFYAIISMQAVALFGIGGIFAKIGALSTRADEHERRLSLLERKA